MTRFAVLVLLVACGGECELVDLVDQHIAGAELTDCGDFPLLRGHEVDPVARQGGRECILSAATDHRPFIVRWKSPGIEGTGVHTLVGREVDGEWQLARFGGSYAPGGRHFNTPVEPCGAEIESDLCVRCEGLEMVASRGID
jgi:hypothetical protein